MLTAHKDRGGYTELIIDADYWRQHEPWSVAAVFYPSTCVTSAAKGRACVDKARQTHMQLLKRYSISARDVPLLRLDVMNWRAPFVEVDHSGHSVF